MARKLNPRERAMLVLLLVAAVVAVYYTGFGAKGLFGGGSDPAAAEGKPLGEPPVVEMTLLGRQAKAYDPEGRDLFQYFTPRPPRQPEPVRVVQVPEPPPFIPPPPPRAINPTLPQPVLPQPGFQYLGFLGPKENKIAVFSTGQEIVLAQVGDVVQERFRVVEFRYETVVMGYTETAYKDKTTELKMRTK